MVPRTRQNGPAPVACKLPAAVERLLREGIEASESDEAIALTPQEAEHYYATGELPERVERWAASRE
jgi:hypothetical protein